MSKLLRLLDGANAAKMAVEAELLRLHPVGSEMRFKILSGQRHPSTGTVLCPGYEVGYLRVRHHESKPGGRYQVREVHHTQILE